MRYIPFCLILVPLHLPVHARAEGLVVVRSEAHIEDRRAVFILLDQLSARLFAVCFIQVDMPIPRRHEQPRRRAGRELHRGDRVGWGVGELELNGFFDIQQLLLARECLLVRGLYVPGAILEGMWIIGEFQGVCGRFEKLLMSVQHAKLFCRDDTAFGRASSAALKPRQRRLHADVTLSLLKAARFWFTARNYSAATTPTAFTGQN